MMWISTFGPANDNVVNGDLVVINCNYRIIFEFYNFYVNGLLSRQPLTLDEARKQCLYNSSSFALPINQIFWSMNHLVHL